jgi:hypothetical protein
MVRAASSAAFRPGVARVTIICAKRSSWLKYGHESLTRWFEFIIKQSESNMSNLISRTTLMTLCCFSLAGCGVAIKSTNLEDVPSRPEETVLLKSMGYVFHDEVYANRDRKYIESEKQSWIEALSSFTDKENIFTMSEGKPSSKIIAFDEFAKTHPVVHVYVNQVPDTKGANTRDVLYFTPAVVSFFSFGIIPAYLPIAYTASFTLSMPEEKQANPAHWDYSYERQEYYWLPILLPMSDKMATFYVEDGEDTRAKLEEKRRLDSRWKTEEKRRLVLRFLQDAKPLLQEQSVTN